MLTAAGALREIRFYQTQFHFCIPKGPFRRLVRELIHDYAEEGDSYRVHVAAYNDIQMAAEEYIVEHMQLSNLMAFHAKRVTIQQRDLRLSRRAECHFKNTGGLSRPR
jgi:histone H3